MDTHSWVLWVGVIAAVLHVLEEHALGWVAWANEELGPRLGVEFSETDFLLTNVALVFIALAGAAIGWWAPAVSLAVPALFIINAVFFHMLPTARSERITPGTISAVIIYLPVAAWMFWAAGTDDQLTFGTFILAFLLGAFIMAYPIAVLMLKSRIGWEATAVTADGPAESSAATDETKEPGTGDPVTSDWVEEPGSEDPVTEDPVTEDSDDDTILLAQDAAAEGTDSEEPTTELRRD